jgi:hypothetical protein
MIFSKATTLAAATKPQPHSNSLPFAMQPIDQDLVVRTAEQITVPARAAMGSRVMPLVLGRPVRVDRMTMTVRPSSWPAMPVTVREACAGWFLSGVRAVRCRRAGTDLPSGISFRRQLRDACLQALFLRPVRF